MKDSLTDTNNILNQQIHSLNCHSRRNRDAFIAIISKQSPVMAARLKKYNDCQAIISHRAMHAVLYQCQLIYQTIIARNTTCGIEPDIDGAALSLDGWISISPFVPCLHKSIFTAIGNSLYEYHEGQWIKVNKTLQIEHDHLSALIKIKPDQLEAQSFLTYHESLDRSYFNRLNELDALVSEAGSSSFKEAIGDVSSHNEITVIWGSFESYYTGMKFLATIISIILVTILIIWILCKCGCCRWSRTRRRYSIQPERTATSRRPTQITTMPFYQEEPLVTNNISRQSFTISRPSSVSRIHTNLDQPVP